MRAFITANVIIRAKRGIANSSYHIISFSHFLIKYTTSIVIWVTNKKRSCMMLLLRSGSVVLSHRPITCSSIRAFIIWWAGYRPTLKSCSRNLIHMRRLPYATSILAWTCLSAAWSMRTPALSVGRLFRAWNTLRVSDRHRHTCWMFAPDRSLSLCTWHLCVKFLYSSLFRRISSGDGNISTDVSTRLAQPALWYWKANIHRFSSQGHRVVVLQTTLTHSYLNSWVKVFLAFSPR